MIDAMMISQPWTYWMADDFLDSETLLEVKNIKHVLPQQNHGTRLNSNRLFVNDTNKNLYPHLHSLFQSLICGYYRNFFEQVTKYDFSNLFPRLEVISDIGAFYLEPHHDLLEKKLSAIVYTDLHQGTTIYDDVAIHHVVESKNNRCMFFIPAPNTMHGYPYTFLHKVRRCLIINYWTYELP
jgi:hypothetical protein